MARAAVRWSATEQAGLTLVVSLGVFYSCWRIISLAVPILPRAKSSGRPHADGEDALMPNVVINLIIYGSQPPLELTILNFNQSYSNNNPKRNKTSQEDT